MGDALAYLVGGEIEPRTADSEAHTPRPEYAVFAALFADRYGVRLLHYGGLNAHSPVIARRPARRALPHWALPAQALAHRPHYAGFLVSGEDVGLPLALQAWLQRRRAPIFIITHGSYMASVKFRRLCALIRRCPHVHFLCLSEALRAALVDDLGVDARQAHNTGYGVDLEFFRPPEKDAAVTAAGGRDVVSAGTANRDYRTLLHAMEGLDAEVRIAADSAWFPTPLDIDTSGLPPWAAVRSYENYRNLRALYASAAFVVVPLHNAAHACGYAVTAEAMAMGKAVVVTRTDSVSDFVVDGETGYLVAPGDVAGMREKVALLLANPDRALQLGRQGRARMETLFSVEAYCERIAAVIQSTSDRRVGRI